MFLDNDSSTVKPTRKKRRSTHEKHVNIRADYCALIDKFINYSYNYN